MAVTALQTALTGSALHLSHPVPGTAARQGRLGPSVSVCSSSRAGEGGGDDDQWLSSLLEGRLCFEAWLCHIRAALLDYITDSSLVRCE